MELVKTTIRSLTTRAQKHDLPDWDVLLTLAVNSPFIRKFAILMKFNQLTAVKLHDNELTYNSIRFDMTLQIFKKS